jgi:ABC-type ATPase with predicted acetyltransferase domain
MSLFNSVVECDVNESFRVAKVAGMFDVPLQKKARCEFSANIPTLDEEWSIGVIVGPSGSGKTTMANEAFPESLVREEKWNKNKAVIDDIGGKDVDSAIAVMTSVGFSSPPSWVKPFHVLSNGEQFRSRLARAILRDSPLFVFDEFTSVVDRTVARIGSAAVAKTIRKRKQRFVAVTCHYDIIDWLEADWVVDMGERTLERRRLRRPKIDITITKGTRKNWDLFSPYHYMSASLAAASQVYVGWWNGRAVSCCCVSAMFGHRGHKRISRIVVLPDFQGVGIGGAMLDTVAELVADSGYRVSIAGRHPSMLSHCRLSKRWSGNRSSLTGSARATNTVRGRVVPTSCGNAIASFEYQTIN